MKEPEQRPQDALVRASNALATRSSGLVQRGLELIRDQQHKRRKVCLLIGNSQQGVTDVIVDTIGHVFDRQVELVVTVTDQAEQLLEYVRDQQFDLCILALNNLSYPARYSLPSHNQADVADYRVKFTEMATRFVADLRRESQLPVIAMAGEGAVSCHSADYYFPMPFPVPEFLVAVEKCLSLKSNSTHIYKPKVLVTDDDAADLKTIKSALESWGYEVVSITDKAKAIERFGEIKPDVVTTDLYSPGLGGRDFIRLVKEIDPSIPVILISAYFGPKAGAAARLGVFDCLEKPFDVAHFQQVIERALKTRRSE